MKMSNVARRRVAHPPVNPMTGLPNAAPQEGGPMQGAPAAGQPASQESAPMQGAPVTGQPMPAASVAPAASTTTAATPAAPAPSATPMASTTAAAAPVAPAVSTTRAASPAYATATTDNELLVERLRAVADSRIVATVVLAALLLAIVGLGNFLPFVVALFLGYVLLDRFVNVRRCIVMGGSAWLAVILVGYLVVGSTSVPIFFSLDYLFMFCGFVFGLAVCLSFFIGRAMYERGMACGQEEADRAIAQHIVGRLIDHPDDWSGLDGDYLECESAINRVRERQRVVEQAGRDEARRKDDLVTYLAHDLKTPLASVVGYLSLLEEAPDLPAEQRVHFTGIALDKAHRLDALIEEFFDITRFDFHDIVLTRGYVDLNLMLGQVVDEFYPILTEQNKSVDLAVEPGLTALIDGDKMARVFNNVMKNAIAYSYERSTIRISAEREEEADAGEGRIVIRFENQGDPIPEPKLKVIFEKFYRLDAARATNRGGAGLGLAIAREIVTAHGGTIACTSTPEHTVFTITLPA